MNVCWEGLEFDSPAGAFDSIAEFYDDDMGRTNPGKDIEFYTQQALEAGGPVLELGCGTGRITIPLLRAGCEVAGLDVSSGMLEVLRKKAAAELTSAESARLTLHRADMSGFELGRSFGSVLCPFSAFNYLVDESAVRSALNCISRHLRPGGRFVLDTFIPPEEVLRRPDDFVYLDYRRPRAGGTILQREKRIIKCPHAQVNLVVRTYSLFAPDGSLLRRFLTRERIRYYHPHQLGTDLSNFFALKWMGELSGQKGVLFAILGPVFCD
jgi:SAM-dependent methyltransferase